MKKVFLVALLATASFASYGQLIKMETIKEIEIGSLKIMGQKIASLSYYVGNSLDTTYVFEFNNAKYTTLDSYEKITFRGGQETVDALYGLFKDAFKSDDIKKYEQNVELGGESIRISGLKTMGLKGVRIANSRGWMGGVSESQLDKIFGKSNNQ